MTVLKIDNIKFAYNAGSENPVIAINDVSFEVKEGEFVALVGHNGSGKSTLAKMLNGLIVPMGGKIEVFGLDTADDSKVYELRSQVGVVFQNPDNQMIATIIEDDIAFGPENLGIPPAEINERVDWALAAVGMSEHRKGTPFRLSGGQKQRIAIAGVLAIKPRILVLDESTSMLDPQGRREVMDVIKNLNRNEKMTVILITHYMDEAVDADRIVIMNEGKLVYNGGTEIFLEEERLESYGLDVPDFIHIANRLREQGVPLEEGILNEQDLEKELCRLL